MLYQRDIDIIHGQSGHKQYALWSRPLVLGCLFSVAVSFAFHPGPFPPLINLIQIPVYVSSYAPASTIPYPLYFQILPYNIRPILFYPVKGTLCNFTLFAQACY